MLLLTQTIYSCSWQTGYIWIVVFTYEISAFAFPTDNYIGLLKISSLREKFDTRSCEEISMERVDKSSIERCFVYLATIVSFWQVNCLQMKLI